MRHRGPVRRNDTVHQPADRPVVEGLVDGRGWVQGEVRMQWQDETGAWWAEVTYRSAEHNSSEIDSFPADRVRKDDREYGAGRFNE